MIYVLDTDHMSVLARGGAPSLALTLRLADIADKDITTSIVSYEEQCKGWLAKTAREKDEGLIRVYAQFWQHLNIYAGIPKERIVLAFQHPSRHEGGEFALT